MTYILVINRVNSFDTADLIIEGAEIEGKPAEVSSPLWQLWPEVNSEVILPSLQHELYPKHKVMGSALHVTLPLGLKSGSLIAVKINYKTTLESTALQWLEKE